MSQDALEDAVKQDDLETGGQRGAPPSLWLFLSPSLGTSICRNRKYVNHHPEWQG